MSADVLNLPNLRVLGNLQMLYFSLSNSKYARLMRLVGAFESIIASFSTVELEQQQSLMEASTARLQLAQKMLQQRVAGKEVESPEDAKRRAEQEAKERPLDLAALAKIMPTLKDAQKVRFGTLGDCACIDCINSIFFLLISLLVWIVCLVDGRDRQGR